VINVRFGSKADIGYLYQENFLRSQAALKMDRPEFGAS